MKRILWLIPLLSLLLGCSGPMVQPYRMLYSKDLGLASAKWEGEHEGRIRCKLGYEYRVTAISDEEGKRHWLIEVWCR